MATSEELADRIRATQKPQPGGPQPTQGGDDGEITLPSPEIQESIDRIKKATSKPNSFRDSLVESGQIPSEDRGVAFVKRVERSISIDTMLGVNVGIAEVLDLPGFLASTVLNKLNSFFPEEMRPNLPHGGFRYIFDTLGQTPPIGKEPDTTAFHTGKLIGNTAATLPAVPFGAGLKTAQGAFTIAGQSLGAGIKAQTKTVVQQIGQTAIATPGKFVTAELTSATGAGLGIALAKERFPDSPSLEFLAAMTGGTLIQFLPIRMAVKAGKGIMNWLTKPFTETGASRRAASRLKKAIPDGDAEAIRKALKEDAPIPEFEGELTPAQRTGEASMMEIQKSVMNVTDAGILAENAHLARLNRILHEVMSSNPELVEVTKQVLETQNRHLAELLQTNFDLAAVRAARRIDDLGPNASPKAANEIAAEELDLVVNRVRTDEKRIWNLVPKSARSSAETATTVYRRLLEELEGFRSLLPSDLDLDKMLGRFVKNTARKKKALVGDQTAFGGKTVEEAEFIFIDGLLSKGASIKQIQELRSRVLQAIRENAAGPTPDNNLIRQLDELQEALLSDLGAQAENISTEAGEAIFRAIAYSRLLNERFRRGVVSKIARKDRAGTEAVPGALTLETVLGGTSAKSAENVRQLIKAVKTSVEGTPDVAPSIEMIGALEDVIKRRFEMAAITGGKFSRGRAESFLKKNEELLDEFPGIKEDIQKAINAEDIQLARGRKNVTVGNQLRSEKLSLATLLIEKSPKAVFEKIKTMRPKEAAEEMTNLLKRVGKDKSGKATEGLQLALFDWLRGSSTTKSILDATERPFISGFRLGRMIEDPQVAPLIGKIFTKEQQRRLKAIQKAASLVDISRNAVLSKEGVVGDTTNRMFTVIAQLFGARSGTTFAKFTGTGGIQAQQIFSTEYKRKVTKWFHDPAAKLISDAFTSADPKLLDALLAKIDTPEDLKRVAKQLNAWAASIMFEFGERTLSEDQDE